MPRLFIITEEWKPQPWYSTGGTRAKKYLQAPNSKFYYFKRSQYKEATDTKPGKDFKYEFWSEVIAYEIGSILGFNLLRYDIAIDGDIMGCISESMINSEGEELIEGIKYLQAFSPNYDPEKKEHQSWYSFQLIVNALEKAKLDDKIIHIIEMIVFDALIGNGDRHQENWAIINHQRLITDALDIMERMRIKISWIERVLLNTMKKLIEKRKSMGKEIPKSLYESIKISAPIYDNGSSLGRELLDERIKVLLESEKELNKYIERGLAEIHWEGRKLSHFELILNLLRSSYYQEVTAIIQRVSRLWDEEWITEIIRNIDQQVPDSHSSYRIPESRKQLITKIITLRYRHLQTLIS